MFSLSTLRSSAVQCPGCGLQQKLELRESPDGWFIVAVCGCGVWRESGYYPTRLQAHGDLVWGIEKPRDRR